MTEATVVSLSPPEVLDPVHERLRSQLSRHALVTPDRARAAVARAIGAADHVVGDWTHQLHLDAELLDGAGRCLAVFQPTAGTDSVDVEHAAALGIPVANAPGTNTERSRSGR
jgi:phosphoglycerate dehydrogenase-like enzyme